MRMLALTLIIAACGPSRDHNGSTDAPGGTDATSSSDAIDDGCAGIPNCYSVYAHSDTTLYVVDLAAKSLMTVGPFNAPNQDVITDLAVAPDGTIWVISETALYTADGTDGHVTLKGSLSACGSRGVALTFTAAGLLYTGDFKGAICQIDITGATPVVKAPTMLQNNMALSGDLVAVGDGTVFGTVYNLSDAANKGTQLSNVLAKLDLTTGAVTQLGATGFPKLFGTSFAHGKVMGFSHDGSGDVVELDPAAGTGVLFATFTDPATQKGIAFAGAGVNSLILIE